MCSFIRMGFRAFGEGSFHLTEHQRSSSIWLTVWQWPIVYALLSYGQSLDSHAKTYDVAMGSVHCWHIEV